MGRPRMAPARPSMRSFRAAFAAFLAAALAAGCASRAPETHPEGVPGFAYSARVIGSAADYVEVVAAHQSTDDRVERIVLVSPRGTETEPDETRRERITDAGYGAPRTSGYVSVGSGYHSRGTIGLFGIGIGFPLVLGGRERGRSVYRTRATIKVSDPEDYRANPGDWAVVIYMRNRERGPFTIRRPAPLPAG